MKCYRSPEKVSPRWLQSKENRALHPPTGAMNDDIPQVVDTRKMRPMTGTRQDAPLPVLISRMLVLAFAVQTSRRSGNKRRLVLMMCAAAALHHLATRHFDKFLSWLLCAVNQSALPRHHQNAGALPTEHPCQPIPAAEDLRAPEDHRAPASQKRSPKSSRRASLIRLPSIDENDMTGRTPNGNYCAESDENYRMTFVSVD